MNIFYVVLFFCCVPMLQGMDSHPQDFQLLKVTPEQNKKKMIKLLEEKKLDLFQPSVNGSRYCHFKDQEIGDIVWNNNGRVCGRVIIETSVYGPLIKLERYQLNENDDIRCTSVSWKNFVRFLPFSRVPFFKDNGDFSCYSYSVSPGNGVPLPILEYSLLEKGKEAVLLCALELKASGEEYSNENPFLVSLGNIIDEDDLLKAILESPFQVVRHMKVYPLADVVFPEYYKPRAVHADLFEHEYLFLPKFSVHERLLVKQAIFYQFVYRRLKVVEEVTKLIKQYFTDV